MLEALLSHQCYDVLTKKANKYSKAKKIRIGLPVEMAFFLR